MLAKYDARPTYYVYPLYKMFGQELIYTSSRTIRTCLVYAALGATTAR